MSNKPRVRVVSATRNGDTVTTRLEVASHADAKSFRFYDTPLAPASIWLIRSREASRFELHRLIEEDGPRLVFETYGDPQRLPKVHAVHVFETWGWLVDGHLRVARIQPSQWQRKEFVPKDMMLKGNHGTRYDPTVKVPPGAKIIPGGWDHEHCLLCWEHIFAADCGERFGYVHDDTWLCEECFEKFIVSGLGPRLG